MTLKIKAGSTDQTIYLFVQDSSQTDGRGLTGLVYNTGSLTAYYALNRGAATSITLATLGSATATHADGGFIAVDGTNQPGLYRLDLPDAAVATGPTVVVYLKGATNMVQTLKEIQLVAYDPNSGTSLGLSKFADIEADTQDIQARLPAALTGAGNMKVDVLALSGDTTAADNAESFFDGTGYAGTNNVIPTVTAVTTVNGLAANVITAAATASDFGTEIGTAVWATSTRLLTAGTNIVLAKGVGVTGFNDLSAAAVNAEVDTALADYDGPTNAEMIARTLVSADYATSAALAVVDSVVDDILVDTGTSLPSQLSTIAGYIDTEIGTVITNLAIVDTVVDAIKVTTDKLDDTLELDSGDYRFTAAALAEAPSGGGGGGATAEEVWEYATRELTSGLNIVLDKGTGLTGLNDVSATEVRAEADGALVDVGLTTTITGRIDAAISTRLASGSYTAPLSAAGTRTAIGLATANLDTQLAAIDTVVDSIKVTTDKLDDTLELNSGDYRFTADALAEAPSGGGGGGGVPWV